MVASSASTTIHTSHISNDRGRRFIPCRAVRIRGASPQQNGRRRVVDPRNTSLADADSASLERHDIAELQLTSATSIDLTVHLHVAVDDGLFHVSTGVEEPRELHELSEANGVAADPDVVDRRRFRHPRMLADRVPSSRPVGDLDRVWRRGRILTIATPTVPDRSPGLCRGDLRPAHRSTERSGRRTLTLISQEGP